MSHISRRDMLILLGLAGGSTAGACLCGGMVAGAGWVMRQKQQPQHNTPIPIVLNRPSPTPDLEYPGIVQREQWGALPPDHTASNESGFYSLDNPEGWRVYDEPLETVYNTVVIHHSASYTVSDRETLEEIQAAHREKRGWADIGYHYLIGKEGAVYAGRNIYVRGTHVESYNTGSIGVCLLGNFIFDYPTDAQIGSAIRLVMWLAHRFELSHLSAHAEYADTQCPGPNLAQYLDSLAFNASLQRGIEGYVPPPEQQEIARSCPCCALI